MPHVHDNGPHVHDNGPHVNCCNFVTNYQICREIGRYDVIKSHMTGRYDVIKSHDWRQPLFQFFLGEAKSIEKIILH